MASTITKITSWINSIWVKTGTENNESVEEYSIGTTFDKVWYSTTNSYSLQHFFETIQTFFNKHMFQHYTKTEPLKHTVVEWYQIIADEAVDAELTD